MIKFSPVLLSIFMYLIPGTSLAVNFEFLSLYSSNGFITEKLLPFAVSSQDPGDFTIESITINEPCYGMIDPYRPRIVHIYCTDAADTQFLLRIKKEGQLSQIQSPKIKVAKVALMSSNPKPKDEPLIKSLGQTLFENNCVSCHKSNNIIERGVTSITLKNAFSGLEMRNQTKTDKMLFFKNFFSNSEINALVNYINEGI